MTDLVENLKNKALEFKDDLKKEEIALKIGDSEHKFRLSGIGRKAIKIEKFISYSDIVEAVENGKESLESDLKNFIEKFEKKDKDNKEE
jgi:hypothetical protein